MAANRDGCTALPERHLYLRRYQDLCPLWSDCSHTVGSFSCGCNAGQAVDWDQPVQLATAVDLNPDPDIVEVNIEAVEAQVEFTPGVITPVYTFNGTVPGPTIEAKIGDTVIAHFTNNLSEETMVHWHGVEVPALADGSPLSQDPVPPGGTFDYQFTVNRASLFWYHPHVRTNEQLERGMHGALLVRDTATDDSLELPPDELLLVLDDVLLDAAGEVEPPWPDDPADRASTQLNGREGNVFLVNGRGTPTVQVRPGVPVRMRMVNVANARFYRLSIDGHEMYRVGGDGGLVAEPVALPAIGKTMGHHGMMMVSDPDPSQGIMMVPGERADIVFTPVGREGDVLELRWHDFPRGRHNTVVGNGGMIEVSHAHDDGERMPVAVMKFELTAGERRQEPWLSPGSLVDVDAVDATGTPVMPVTFGHSMPDMAGDVMFFATMVNGVGVPFSQLTVEQAHAATVGDVRTWEVTNMTGGDHPFHTHGFVFQHLETEYIDMVTPENNRVVPAARVEDKDSFRVPKRSGAKGTSRTVARFAVRFDDSGREGQVAASGKAPGVGTSGGWLLHCHTLEHAARGMMTFLNLYEPLP
jgi:FtsP/CotA-like multicopper oxidase with cupredoxin domain